MVVLGLTLFVPLNLFAQNSLYIALKPGIYSPRSADLNGFNNGFSGDFTIGYRFNPNIALEGGFGYFDTGGNKTFTRGASFIQAHYDINVWSLTATLKGILPYKKWEFFGLAGGGIYTVSVPYDTNGYHHQPYPYYYSDYTSVWGGYLGAGIQYNITPGFFLGVEGKYLWTDDAKYSNVEKFNLDGIISNAIIGFRF